MAVECELLNLGRLDLTITEEEKRYLLIKRPHERV